MPQTRLNFYGISTNRYVELEAAWRTLRGLFPEYSRHLLCDAYGELYSALKVAGVWEIRPIRRVVGTAFSSVLVIERE